MSIYIFNAPRYDWEHLKSSYFKYVKPSSTVLEIGAASKDLTSEICTIPKKVIAIEHFVHQLHQDFLNVKYVLGDWQKLSRFVKPNSIDVAISSHTIEHVAKDLQSINELYLVLKKGGAAVINTPNRLRLTRKIIELFTGEKTFPCGEHVREYSYQDLVDLLNKSKFTKFTITPIVFGLHGASKYAKIYSTYVPKFLSNYANYWEIILLK